MNAFSLSFAQLASIALLPKKNKITDKEDIIAYRISIGYPKAKVQAAKDIKKTNTDFPTTQLGKVSSCFTVRGRPIFPIKSFSRHVNRL